jgi:hypothetical protein
MKYKYTDFGVDQRLIKRNDVAVWFGLTEDSLRPEEEKYKSRFTPMSFVVVEYKLKELF